MPAGSVSRHSVSVLAVVLTDVGVGSGVVAGGGVVVGAGDGVVDGVVGGVVAGVVEGVVAGGAVVVSGVVVVVPCGIVVAARVFEIRNNKSVQQTATLCLYRLTK